MSSADRAQNRHMVPMALQLRVRRVFECDASWRDWQQLGVLIGELAESARIIGWADWRVYHRTALEAAYECLTLALQMLPEYQVVHVSAVVCDRAVALARLALHQCEPAVTSARAVQELREAADMLERHFDMQRPADNPEAWHQLAIARAWLARVLYGRDVLGFVGVAMLSEPQLNAQCNDARKRFSQELALTPDSARAHRALLLSLAVVGLYRKSPHARRTALHAARLAARHRDVLHAARAMGLITIGPRTDRLLRLIRDGRTLRRPLPGLPFYRSR